MSMAATFPGLLQSGLYPLDDAFTMPGDTWANKYTDVQVRTGKDEAGLAILGLPLMNGYFTIFDGEADDGRGVIKFASKKI